MPAIHTFHDQIKKRKETEILQPVTTSEVPSLWVGIHPKKLDFTQEKLHSDSLQSYRWWTPSAAVEIWICNKTKAGGILLLKYGKSVLHVWTDLKISILLSLNEVSYIIIFNLFYSYIRKDLMSLYYIWEPH